MYFDYLYTRSPRCGALVWPIKHKPAPPGLPCSGDKQQWVTVPVSMFSTPESVVVSMNLCVSVIQCLEGRRAFISGFYFCQCSLWPLTPAHSANLTAALSVYLNGHSSGRLLSVDQTDLLFFFFFFFLLHFVDHVIPLAAFLCAFKCGVWVCVWVCVWVGVSQ